MSSIWVDSISQVEAPITSTDIIYGITMIEAGGSRVVPVDLRELA